MIRTHNQGSMKHLAFFIGKQLMKVFLIVAPGFMAMYYCEDSASAAVAGACYLIAIVAIIIVLMADDYERKAKRLFHAGTI